MTTFIDDHEFDEQFRRTLSAATRGCADLGEALAVASRITPYDFTSWSTEWIATADTVRAEADTSRDAGDLVSARRAYLRAAEYYRQAFFFARTDLDNTVLHATHPAHVAAFRAALPFLPGATTVMDIAVDGVVARGYLFRPDATGQPRPTIIAPAGYDSTAESGYSFTAVSALEHGMNCVVFEGPGQGGVLYQDRIPFRPDTEAVLPPIIDWILTQPGVDPGSLVLFGRSFAGYLAPRAATAERRLAALICDPAQYDLAAVVRRQAGEANWARLQNHDPRLEADLTPMLADPHDRNGLQWRMAAHGVTTLTDYLRELSQFSLVGIANRISCPTLALAGEGDFAGTGQINVFADALDAPVTTHQFTVAEGAGGHCEGLSQDRLDTVVYGWLTRTLHQH